MSESEVVRDDEISLRELVMTLIAAWKVLVAGGLAGLVIGAAAWFVQGYKGEMTNYVRQGALNVVSWNALVAGFPGLAAAQLEVAGGKERNARALAMMGVPAWWKTNVSPAYVLSKSDIKDLAGISKADLDAASNSIQRIAVKVSGRSRDEVRILAVEVESFIRKSALYLALKSQINAYEQRTEQRPAQLQEVIARTERELVFLGKRVAVLEALRREYPDQKGAAFSQVMDPKDSAAKFLPLNTQLVAAKSDLNEAQEKLARARSELGEIEVLRKYTDKALGLLGSNSDGFVLESALQTEVRELAKQVSAENRDGQLAVAKIQSDIDTAMVQRGKLFEGHPHITVARSGLGLPLGLGLMGGLMFGVLAIFIRKALQR
ncbi:MAG: hypothetical protein QMB55_06400 [Propionivibrio sp.]